MDSGKVGGSGHGTNWKGQVKSHGDAEDTSSEAANILVEWITEDADAVANSFGVNSAALLEITLKQLEPGATGDSRNR